MLYFSVIVKLSANQTTRYCRWN